MKRILCDHYGLIAFLAAYVALGYLLMGIFGEPRHTSGECEPNGVYGGALDC